LWSKSIRKSQNEKALKKQQLLEKELKKSKDITSRFYKLKSNTNGMRTTTYSKTWLPFLDRIINCNSWSSTELEKKAHKASTKDSK